jgi:hypothetical protein
MMTILGRSALTADSAAAAVPALNDWRHTARRIAVIEKAVFVFIICGIS